MGTIEFITDCLAGVHMRLTGSCNGLTREQALWRLAPQANNIGFVLWHFARAEDGNVVYNAPSALVMLPEVRIASFCG